MDEAQLERALFELFEKQPRWTIPKLAEATKQVPSYMRGVLEKVRCGVRTHAHTHTDMCTNPCHLVLAACLD